MSAVAAVKAEDRRRALIPTCRLECASNRVFPSLDTIARMAMVSKRTVLNLIAWLALLVSSIGCDGQSSIRI